MITPPPCLTVFPLKCCVWLLQNMSVDIKAKQLCLISSVWRTLFQETDGFLAGSFVNLRCSSLSKERVFVLSLWGLERRAFSWQPLPNTSVLVQSSSDDVVEVYIWISVWPVSLVFLFCFVFSSLHCEPRPLLHLWIIFLTNLWAWNCLAF